MALIPCPECKKEISDQAAACPHCGFPVTQKLDPQTRALIKKISLAGCVVLLIVTCIIALLFIARRFACTARDDQAEHNLQWKYTENDDSVSGKSIKTASVDSLNVFAFEFPDDGGQRALLSLRSHPRLGLKAYIQIKKGQFLCNDKCPIPVRFDDGTPETYYGAKSGDTAATTLSIGNAERLLANVKKSEKVYIEPSFYGEGTRVLEFEVSGLKW